MCNANGFINPAGGKQQLRFLVSTQLPPVNKQITQLLTVARQRASHSVPAGVGGAAYGFLF